MFTKADMRKVVSAYESNGIVTRNDFFKIDSRPLAKEVLDELRRIGYTEAMITETSTKGRTDYSSAIYNPEHFEPKEADEYLIQNVLK